MIVVDTNVWSEALRPLPNANVAVWIARNEAALQLSSIVLAELVGGAALMQPGRKRQSLSNRIALIVRVHAERVCVFDERAAQEYGYVLELRARAGQPIETADAMIAAMARAHGAKVATRDIRGFSGTGVTLVNPWEPGA